jgi:bifunctional DNase/RNase
MKNDVIEVKVKGIIPTTRGCAVFLGNDQKIFTIYVDHSVGQAIAMFIQDTPKERPLTHDLIASIFMGLGVRVKHIVVNELKSNTYFARLILHQENELGKKIIEVDARPSDSIALALQQKCPIYCAKEVFDEVEDMTEVLKQMNENAAQKGTAEFPFVEESEEEEGEEGEEGDEGPGPGGKGGPKGKKG